MRNKARLVAKGYNKQEDIDYETYARLEAIRILIVFSCVMDFKLFQMDVKGVFLNGYIQEEMFVGQPSNFVNFSFFDNVFKLKKTLYSQAHRI